jgi:hypothetical protein
MTTLALTEGMYQARSVIAASQRCVNLYPEVNQKQSILLLPQGVAPSLVTHYPTPGLRTLCETGFPAEVRCLFRANNNLLYTVIGSSAYLVNSNWSLQLLGVLATSEGQVRMMDNGRTLIVVDGSPTGYAIDLPTSNFGTISDPAYYGATCVDYLGSFLVFNQPDTQNFYCTLSDESPQYTSVVAGTPTTSIDALNALYTAQKSGYGDNLVALVSLDKQLWLFGQLTTEIWYLSGGATFPFAATPNGLIEHGCGAQYSAAKIDDTVIWLSISITGSPVVLQGSGYTAQRISTNAIENEIQNYPRVDDAIAMTYQQLGHSFYILTFPSAGKTWVYDNSTSEWHERMFLGGNGREQRWRPNCLSYAYGEIVAGDYENGSLYSLDINTYTDAGQAIKRIRGFPHFIQEAKRVVYRKFIADIQCGESIDTLNSVGTALVQQIPNVIGFTSPVGTGIYGAAIAFNGYVNPTNAPVEIAVGTSSTSPPDSGWQAVTVIAGTWSGSVTVEV